MRSPSYGEQKCWVNIDSLNELFNFSTIHSVTFYNLFNQFIYGIKRSCLSQLEICTRKSMVKYQVDSIDCNYWVLIIVRFIFAAIYASDRYCVDYLWS